MSQSQEPLQLSRSWQLRLEHIVETMREMSLQADPQEMVRNYALRMREVLEVDRFVAISCRDLEKPHYRITRCTMWENEINPWKERDQLPLLEGGLLSELLYRERPQIIDELAVDPNDPARDYFAGQRSLVAIPQFDRGKALNMAVLMRAQPDAFNPEQLPELVWMHGLFGRATHNLVLREELQNAYDRVDREMQLVADIQRSLLPSRLPDIPTLRLAACYQTSQRAGGDYYDLFRLPDGRWGILIADVSGHGTPAAVLMAITHSIAHAYAGPSTPAGQMLAFVNSRLTARYTVETGTFVTAFYGIYDPATRTLSYATAGHNPPRLRRARDDQLISIDGEPQLPLGIQEDLEYQDTEIRFEPGDVLLFYTDGAVEAHSPAGKQFGVARLDAVLREAPPEPAAVIEAIQSAIHHYTAGAPPEDDRTLLVARVM